MTLRFTKMQGAGNDFVVLDGVTQPVALTAAQYRRLADRRLGVGADQVLLVEPAVAPGADFRYRIFNADGGEVEQCGNGARCFVRFVHERGLTHKRAIRVETLGGLIEPSSWSAWMSTSFTSSSISRNEESGLISGASISWKWPLDFGSACRQLLSLSLTCSSSAWA